MRFIHTKLLILVLFCSSSVIAQDDFNIVQRSTDKIFIKDVFIKRSADAPISMGSILLDKGKIAQIGNIKPPFDAKIIKADSMYAYPGFIAGLSHGGMKKVEDGDKKPTLKFKGAPPNNLAGITPEHQAQDYYNPEETSIERFREAGFTLVNAAPQGRMLPGTAAVFSTGTLDAEMANLKANTAMFAQFRTASGMYPATVIAIMAKWRDLYQNASLASKYKMEYAKNANLGSRPKYDKSTLALIPVTQKQIPVFFKTPKAKDVYRAIELKRELGFDMVLTELKQASEMINYLRNNSNGILLSTELPKKMKEIEEDEDERSIEQKGFDEKRMKSIESYVNQASTLEQSNLNFGFSFLEGKANDFKENLDRMLAAGLSENAALKALTSYPAQLLGISSITGTLDQGKLANVVISDKNYFEEGSKIKYVIVEGELFDLTKKSKKKKNKSTDGEMVELIGAWTYEVVVFGESQTGKLLIEEGDELEVKIISDDPNDSDPKIARNVERDGDNLSFNFDVDADGQALELTMDIVFDGDDFEGKITGVFGEFEIEGTRKAPKF